MLTGLAALAHYDAMNTAGQKLKQALRRELAQYRMVLLLPAALPVPEPPVAKPPEHGGKAGRASRIKARAQKFMDGMDPALAGFVRQHSGLESVVAAEIFRDMDSGALDPASLLKQSRLRVSFRLDDSLHIMGAAVDESSGVPSIDHLALELIQLLEKYPVLWAFKGIRQVEGYFRIEDESVKVELTALPAAGTRPEEIQTRVRGAIALLQMSWPKEDFEFVFGSSILTTETEAVRLRKDFNKSELLEYLMQFLQPSK